VPHHYFLFSQSPPGGKSCFRRMIEAEEGAKTMENAYFVLARSRILRVPLQEYYRVVYVDPEAARIRIVASDCV
jgi:hypothetical protein